MAASSPPQKSKEDKSWKDNSFVRLLTSCGSGKSKDAKNKTNVLGAAPLPPPESFFGSKVDDAYVNTEVETVTATRGHGNDDEVEISYSNLKEIGQGTFGIVYSARMCDTGEIVAIKKTLDDPKFKNRELMMMRALEHPNILNLCYFYYSTGVGYKSHERYLNMVLDYIPETLFSVTRCDGTYSIPLPDLLDVKVYTYQLFRCLAYLHHRNICHRDVKPQNLLLDPDTRVIKLCDFGSAKELAKGDTNVAYICSRYYRSPELILGATDYTCQADVWSAGCVLAELFQGHPIFPGANGPDQMVEVIKVLGTPNFDDLNEINPRFTQFRFPYLAPHPWEKVITKNLPPPDGLDLISRTLMYSPIRRITPMEALAHPFYDELRRQGTRFKNGRRLPPLFNFTPEELEINPALNYKLIPNHNEDDEPDYLDVTPDTALGPGSTERSNSEKLTPLARLGSLRNSLRMMKIPQVNVKVKKGKKEKKSKKAEDVSAAGTEDGTAAQDERVAADGSKTETEDEAEERDCESTSVTFPEIHHKPDSPNSRQHNGGRGAEDFADSFVSSAADRSGVENQEAGDTDATEKKKKKKKRRPKLMSAESTEGDDDDAATDGEKPFASTPAGKAERLADSPSFAATPPHDVEAASDFATEEEAIVTKKTKKKKKTSESTTSSGVVEHTEVTTETVVVTSSSSKKKKRSQTKNEMADDS